MHMNGEPHDLFQELEDTSPIGVATELFYERTEDYLAVVQLGMDGSYYDWDDAKKVRLIEAAEHMGSAALTFATELHTDNPDAALDETASILTVHERMQHAKFKTHLNMPPSKAETLYDSEVQFKAALRTGLAKFAAQPVDEKLGLATHRIVMMNARAWIRTIAK